MNSSKKILVTGGAGYIGSHTVVELVNAGYKPVVVDNFSGSDRTLTDGIEKITGKPVEIFEGDCCDKVFLRQVFESTGPIHSVLHFAAYKSVGESVEKPLAYYQNNVGSLVALLEVMQEYKVRDFIFSSSCTVYGQPDQIPVNESAPLKERNRLMERLNKFAKEFWRTPIPLGSGSFLCVILIPSVPIQRRC